jgi:NAD(P)-dependent dehydrogenase (short-subunit alcohol dehydrogenase family)
VRVVAVTGSASGIGAAVRARLATEGTRVIGVDRDAADVRADLGTAAGRAAAVRGVLAACGGRLDGAVACAGVGPHTEPWATIVSVNYFGAQAVLDGLRPALAAGEQPAAVAVSSNASTIPGNDGALVTACLAGDEDEAGRLALDLGRVAAYGGSKLALARWVRRSAPAWAKGGVRLNAVAPGAVATPLLQGTLDDAELGPAVRGFPIPLGGFGTPAQIAAAIAFLLGPDAAFCAGSVLFVDGGTDALLRRDAY